MVWENEKFNGAICTTKKGIVFYQKCYETGTVMDFFLLFCPFKEAVTQASEL